MEIVWLDDPACRQRALSGGKAANLSRLVASCCVPPGFCLTTKAFELLSPSDSGLSSVLSARVAVAYEKLGELCQAQPPAVAVRSSAVGEDSSRTSFAGQHETYLNIKGLDAVLAAIWRCWLSTRSARARDYRLGHLLRIDSERMAVLVQQMIPADISVVVFGANPVRNSDKEILINANWGLGESIVAGKVTPDAYVVDRQTPRVVSPHIAEKRTMSVPREAGIRDAKIPRILSQESSLTENQVAELARLANMLEGIMGYPVDLECSYCDGKLYLLQCRPLTSARTVLHPGPQSRVEQARDTPVSPLPIELPAEFPVIWANPEDANAFWTVDRMHVPRPVPPLAEPFLDHVYVTGVNFAARAYGWPFRSSARRINGFHYWSITPLQLSQKQLLQENETCWKKLEVAMDRLREIWDSECLPEIQHYLCEWEGFDRERATLAELLAHLDTTVAWSQRVWELHFLILFPFLCALSTFDELAQDLFGGEKALDQYRLLQGFDNKSLECDRALWELSRKSRAAHQLDAIAGSDPLGALQQSGDGKAFLAEVRVFLDEYGRRNGSLLVSDPAWIENPGPVWNSILQYVRLADRDPLEKMKSLQREREERITQARALLTGYPLPVLARFEVLLKAAQEASVLQEDHNFWIDQRCLFAIRRVLIEFGHRLFKRCILAAPDDVFFLTLPELREAASTESARDQRPLVAARRQQIDRFRGVVPPPALGTPPSGSVPETALGRAFDKFFGLPLPATGNPHLLRGYAASAGKAHGQACVVGSLTEARRLRRGQILVTEATLPPWTPLFLTAAAVVTDVGGVTSHSAIIAREYGLPAVVGVGDATRRIADGQWVEVDGSAGLVWLVSSGDNIPQRTTAHA